MLITFTDLLIPSDPMRFFASPAAEKSGISCLGFIAKRANWYPKAHMLAAAPEFVKYLAPYTTRITYGGSMGGYAALKFSRLLGASHVITLCPQFSIDPADCGQDPGWSEYYQPAMAGMGLRAEEILGEVFIFSDAYDQIDCLHDRLIREVCPKAVIINVPRTGHHVTSVFAGTQNLLQLIEAVRARDFTKLIRFSREARAGHAVRHEAVAQLAATRRAALLLRNTPPSHPAGFGKILTHHGTCLIFPRDARICTHEPYHPEASQHPVRLNCSGMPASLFIELGHMRLGLGVRGDGRLTLLHGTAEPPAHFTLASPQPGFFTFHHNGHYLCAEPNGGLICNRRAASPLEQFQLG